MSAQTGIVIRWPAGERRIEDHRTVTLGRDPGSDVPLDAPSVSRAHAELRREGSTWVLVDLDSRQGTFVDGKRIGRVVVDGPLTATFGHVERGVRVELVPDVDDRTEMADGLTSAATELPAERPGGHLRSDQLSGATLVSGDALHISVGAASRVLAPGDEVVIGRDADCDFVSANPTVSRRHARVYRAADGWRIDDLGSRGGTYVDDKRITSGALAGANAVWLGDPATGERVVAVAGGDRHMTPAARLDRVARRRAPLVLAVTAVIALVAVGIGALALTRRGSTTSPATDDLARATVFIDVGDATGSGSVVDARRGLVLTNAHVVDPQAPGQSLTPGGEQASKLRKSPSVIKIGVSPGLDRAAETRYQASVVASDGYLDLAVVKITKTAAGAIVDAKDMAGLVELELGNSDDVKSGDPVRVVGYPGIAGSSAPTVTAGEIASPTSDDRLHSNRAEFNTTASINHGNSGGVAVDRRGRLIGVPSSAVTNAKEVEKVGQIRPINFARDLIARAQAAQPYISPYVTPLDAEAVTNIRFVAGVATAGFTLGCNSRVVNPEVGDRQLTVAFDYSGFKAGTHQDLLLGVLANGDFAGGAATGSQFPFTWKDHGCATVTVDLARRLAPAADYQIVVQVGPNYERQAALSDKFSLGPASPAPAAPAPAAPPPGG